MRRRTFLALPLFAAMPSIGAAQASSFAPKLIQIVVPFPAGGPTDVLARHIGHALSEELKTSVVIDNRAGANAMIGTAHVAKSSPDGTTLLFNATHQVVNPALIKDLLYDPQKDFWAIGLGATVPNALVVHPSVQAKTLEELIALAKQAPGKLSYGAFGGANQLAGELFKYMAGVDIQHVPYRGSGPAMNDLMGGHIPMMFDSLPTTLPLVQNGKLRVLGVTSAQRSPSLPEVPAISEVKGLEGYEATAWFGLFMPAAGKGSAADLALQAAMAKILKRDDIKTKFAALGAVPGTLSGAEFQAFVAKELAKWRDVAKKAGIEPQ